MNKAEQPIGIFDSGVGGLTVARAINALLPQESLIYFGDTAHTPWGNQSATAIQHYATRITHALLEANCKIIVIACNTASAAALEAVQHIVGNKALVFNVIDPVIEHLIENFQTQTVGLIGTKQTIKSQAYASRLNARCTTIDLKSMATPLLAPLIEEGFSNTDSTREIIQHYLSNPEMHGIAALILGCTHYPLIKQRIADYLGDRVEVIDSAQIIAKAVADKLAQANLLNTSNNSSKTFYVSHDSDFFNSTAQQFFPGNIQLQTYPLWE